MNKLYVVKKGHKPGIYFSWNECKEQIYGYSRPVFKKVKSIEEAENFLHPKYYNQSIEENSLWKRTGYEAARDQLNDIFNNINNNNNCKLELKNSSPPRKKPCIYLRKHQKYNNETDVTNNNNEKDSDKNRQNSSCELINNPSNDCNKIENTSVDLTSSSSSSKLENSNRIFIHVWLVGKDQIDQFGIYFEEDQKNYIEQFHFSRPYSLFRILLGAAVRSISIVLKKFHNLEKIQKTKIDISKYTLCLHTNNKKFKKTLIEFFCSWKEPILQSNINRDILQLLKKQLLSTSLKILCIHDKDDHPSLSKAKSLFYSHIFDNHQKIIF